MTSQLIAQRSANIIHIESKSDDEVFALARQADELAKTGNNSEAIAIWEQVLTWAELRLGPQHRQTVAVLSTLAGLYSNQGNYRKAEPLYVRALEISEKTLGASHSDTGIALNNLGFLYSEKGEYKKAIALYNRALVISEQTLGPEHPETAVVLNNLAARHKDQGQYDKAESLYKRSLAIARKANGPESTDAAKALNNLAELLSFQGRYEEAEALHLQALVIREKALGTRHPDAGASLNNLAYLYAAQGLYNKAKQAYIRALSILESSLGPEHPSVIIALSNLASNYSDMGQYGEAISLSERALQISEKVFGPNHPTTGTLLNNLGGRYSDQGQYGKAEKLYLRSLAISQDTQGPEHLDVALAYNNLAWLYGKQGNHVKAEKLYRQSLTITERNLGGHHLETANRLENLAASYSDQGIYDKAEPLYLRALAIKRKILGQDHPEVATTMNQLALLYGDQGEFDNAEPLHIQSLAIRQKAFDKDHPYIADAIKVLARHYGNKGEYDKAIAALRQSLDLELNWLTRELPLLPEEDRFSQMQVLGNAWEVSFGWIPKSQEARDLALYTRLNIQGLASEIEQRQKLVASIASTSPGLAQRLQSLTRKLSSISISKDQRNILRDKRDQLQRQLNRQLPDLEIRPVTALAVAKALPKDGALIEFQQYRPFDSRKPRGQRWGKSQYIALILKPNGAIASVALGPADRINDLILKALTASAQDQSDANFFWAKISNQLIKPLMPELRSSREWFISLDAELNRVPFAALPEPEDSSKTLGETTKLRLLTTGRELLRLQKSTRTASKPVVLANPDFSGRGNENTSISSSEVSTNPQTRSIKTRSTIWSRLPGTEQEGRRVASLLSTGVISGADASASTLQHLQSPLLLHIATHGFFLADQDSKTAGSMMSVEDSAPPLKALQQENPQLRSGLVLAGANQIKANPADDGYLTAAEAVMLNLKGTEMVVLSACSTGQGDIRTGEGVYGLQRALTVAGARSTLLSLWKVDDEATAEFMERFYTRLKAGESRSDALAATQKEFRDGTAGNRQWRDPYYWAAWQLVGDWRPIKGL